MTVRIAVSRAMVVLALLATLALPVPVFAEDGFVDMAPGDCGTFSGWCFDPETLVIEVGDSVTWTNQTPAPHTATELDNPDGWTTPTLMQGESFTITFLEAGVFEYFCIFHQDMFGTLEVVEPAARRSGGLTRQLGS
jgi:plastocyanin